MYDKGKHLDWWQSLPATERFPLMKKYDINQVSNKLIHRMFNGEFPMTREKFIKKWLGEGHTYIEENIDEMRDDLDKVIETVLPQANVIKSVCDCDAEHVCGICFRR